MRMTTENPYIGYTRKGSQLSKIDVIGLKRYSQNQVIVASGLQIGQKIDSDAVKAAAQRLSKSGLFKSLSYNFRFNNGQMEIKFQVEENETIPCTFDNFVWFNNEEILNAIRMEVPTFDGTAPK